MQVRYKCPVCKNVTVIQRVNMSLRKRGHRKVLWCVRCKKRTDHYQL